MGVGQTITITTTACGCTGTTCSYTKGAIGVKDSFHLFTAAPLTCFKAQYQALRGDHLKQSILTDFKRQIDSALSKSDLAALKTELKKSAEYAVLAKSQSLFTSIIGTTSSVQAFEDMIKQKERLLSDPALAPKK